MERTRNWPVPSTTATYNYYTIQFQSAIGTTLQNKINTNLNQVYSKETQGACVWAQAPVKQALI